MSLRKKTQLGTIIVNNNVIAKVVLRAVEKTDGKFMLSSEKGRILGVASRVGVGDISGNFNIECSADTFSQAERNNNTAYCRSKIKTDCT